MRRPLLILASVLAGTSLQASHNEHVPIEVQTKLGTIRGQESIFLHKHVRSFLGVPFAEPPTGQQRFKPPKPKQPWKEVHDANTLTPACYQGRDEYNTSFWGSEMWNPNTPVSEDCLYMNIWAPADAYNLSVMVWLYGGGYTTGSPSLVLYDGKALAVTGNVVVVNINYRVGPFGYLFMDHPDAPGNMGMLDQQMALYWIRDHIFSFGGDPGRVTLFGESAGAASIVAHLIAPHSQRLFKNGILQSGSLDNKWSMDSPKRAKFKAEKLAEQLGCNETTTELTLRCMRGLSPDVITAHIYDEPLQISFLEFPFVIVSRDRNFFKDKDGFVSLRNGDYAHDVNLMIGINHDEGNFWNIYNLAEYFDKQQQPAINRDEFHDCIERAFVRQPEMVRNAAKFVYSDPNCTDPTTRTTFYAEQVNQMVGDYFFTCDSLWLSDNAGRDNERHKGDVYIYYFDQPSSANPWPQWTGTMHGYEIEYVFGVPLYNDTAGYTKREETFSRKVIEFWSSFADTGKPRLREQKSHEHWPEYDEKTSRRWMLLKGGSHMRAAESSKRVECALWRQAKDIEYNQYLKELEASSSPALLSLTSVSAFLVYHYIF